MLFPTDIQVAVLYDRPVSALAELVQVFIAAEGKEHGVSYNVVEQRTGAYYLIYGTNQQMVSFEYLDGPANPAVFQQAVDSPVCKLIFPAARDVIARHRSHILISVQHGAMGGGEIQQMLAKMGMDVPGNGYPAFAKRLAYAARLGRMALVFPGASLVHWTQSNQVYPPDAFAALCDTAAPGPLHVHPHLFGGGQNEAGEELAGILTFGVRHFLGREVEIEPSPIPWAENWQLIFTFMRVALTENGYVIPDGDTFGNEDRTVCCKVHHLPVQDGQVPLYRLEPLLHTECGFESPDYIPELRRIDPDRPPAAVMPVSPSERAELMGEWRASRAMAEGIGGSLIVKVKGDTPLPPPPPLPQNRLGRVFGRKGV
jgi:hypothetical protein